MARDYRKQPPHVNAPRTLCPRFPEELLCESERSLRGRRKGRKTAVLGCPVKQPSRAVWTGFQPRVFGTGNGEDGFCGLKWARRRESGLGRDFSRARLHQPAQRARHRTEKPQQKEARIIAQREAALRVAEGAVVGKMPARPIGHLAEPPQSGPMGQVFGGERRFGFGLRRGQASASWQQCASGTNDSLYIFAPSRPVPNTLGWKPVPAARWADKIRVRRPVAVHAHLPERSVRGLFALVPFGTGWKPIPHYPPCAPAGHHSASE